MSQYQNSLITATRKNSDELNYELEYLRTNPIVVSLLNGIPNMVLILNTNRQIVFANKAILQQLGIESLESITGMRPGELLGCPSVVSGPEGCGTSENCRVCGINKALRKSIDFINGTEECTIKAGPSAMMHLKITTEMIRFGEKDFILYSMQDISNEKKNLLLERIFYHDILNSAHNINSMAEILTDIESDENKQEYLDLLKRSAGNLINEINTQRILSSGKLSDYIGKSESINSQDFFEELKSEFETLSHGAFSIEPDNRSENFDFIADKVLLKRIISNMIRNAIEAEENRGIITFGFMNLLEKGAMLWVHNKSYMSEDVQLQIFNRSFSTKGTDRGLGTYSMKLLTEKVMKGKISYTSSQINGTTFIVEIPVSDSVLSD